MAPTLYGLEFYNHRVLDDQIESVPDIKLDGVIYNRQRDFAMYLESSFHQLMSEANGIRALQQPRSQRRMNLHC